MTEESNGQWEELKVDNEFEIFSEFPYPIRRKGSDRIIREHITDDGYLRCFINGKKYLRHRLIAQQWIPNDDPEHKTQIDHINHNRADNRLENLRWCSMSENQKNLTRKNGYHFIYLDKLPETAESLDAYNGHEFDGLYIDYETQKLYLFNGKTYRKLVMLRDGGYLYYNCLDIENKQRKLAHKVLFG